MPAKLFKQNRKCIVTDWERGLVIGLKIDLTGKISKTWHLNPYLGKKVWKSILFNFFFYLRVTDTILRSEQKLQVRTYGSDSQHDH